MEDIALFAARRTALERQFLELAAQRGKPRDVRWIECEWQPEVAFGRDRRSGLLTAFVGLNVRFEAVEGGTMEDVAAVGNIRDATALFHCQHGQWGTGGRALFNMGPRDALRHLASQYEPIAPERGA